MFIRFNGLIKNEKLNTLFLLVILVGGVSGFIFGLSGVEINAKNDRKKSFSQTEESSRKIQLLQGTSSRMRVVDDSSIKLVQLLDNQKVFISGKIENGELKVVDQILIDGNADFANQASLNGWPGSGTKEDPYIIENVLVSDINNQTDVMVDIRNVSVHFIFRNNIVTVNESFIAGGIRLINVSNGILEKLVIDTQINSVFGIRLENSFNNTVRECSIKNVRIGIRLIKESVQNRIIANRIDAQAASLHISDRSRNNWIINNSFQHAGIILNPYTDDVSSMLQVEVNGNEINGKPLVYWQGRTGDSVPRGSGQVILVNCTNITIAGQEITGVARGIQLFHLSNSLIIDNVIKNDLSSGIYLDHGINNTFKNNTVLNSKKNGFDFVNSWDTLFTENVVINNTMYGFRVSSSSRIILEGNIASLNGYSGFFIGSSANFILISNIAERNGRDGFVIPGVEVTLGTWAVMHRNLAQSNSLSGISLGPLIQENMTVTNNTLVRNNYAGLSIIALSSPIALIKYNTFLDNGQVPHPGNQTAQIDAMIVHPETMILEYNHWSDHTEPDEDQDGIVDVPYPSANISIMDPYPLTTPADSPPEHLIGQVRLVNPSEGEVITESLVPIEWTPVSDSWNHSVKYDLFISISSNSTNESKLVSNIQDTKYSLNVANYPNGSVIHLRIIAKDVVGISSENTSSFIIMFVVSESSQNSSPTPSNSPSKITSWSNIFIIVGMMTTFFLVKPLNGHRKRRKQ